MPKALLALMLLAMSITVSAQGRAFLVDSSWLEEHIDDDGLVILEVRYHPHRYFTVGHIEGARQVQRFKDLGDNQSAPLMRFPSREAFQDSLRRWGVNDDSTVLVYDDSMTALAARVVFLLDLYGFNMNQVKVLDGGTVEWTAFEELSKDPVKATPGTVTLKAPDAKMFVEWPAVYDDVVSRRDKSVVLLDARPADMYTGEVIQHSVRGGHIPGAINIVSLDGVDSQSQAWKTQAELKAMYAPIDRGQTVYVYCHDGFRMSLAWLQMKALGYGDVRLYNGGWSHWGNALTLPVVQGAAPYDEEYAL